MKIKLLTLNTHSLIEENYEEKLGYFVEAVVKKRPDIIALQEVNQSADADRVDESWLVGHHSCNGKVAVREDNHAYRAIKKLRERGLNYNWCWLGVKNGYGNFDEGLAVFSLSPISDTKIVRLSSTHDYKNWRTRKALGIKVGENWFYSVHFSWWADHDEPFIAQWARMLRGVRNDKISWLLGDFNNPANAHNEGYDTMLNFGWHDTFKLAEKRDSGYTVDKAIDGWHDKLSVDKPLRIDLVMCSERRKVISSEVIFNGINEPVVSDHYGVLVELG